MSDLQKELKALKRAVGIIQKEYCSEEDCARFRKMDKREEPLPDGVYYVDGIYCRDVVADLSEEERDELFFYRKMYYLKSMSENIKTIKTSVVFFVVLTIISLIAGFILAFNAL